MSGRWGPRRGCTPPERANVSYALDHAEHERTLKAGNYLHYLHHRYFTVNFGNDVFPFDRWYGSFHDGSPEMHAAMLDRRKQEKPGPG